MDKILCPRCSEGIEITPNRVIYAHMTRAIVSYSDDTHRTVMMWYRCETCYHSYFSTYSFTDEGIRNEASA